MPPRGVKGWIPDQFQTLESANTPRTYKVITRDGEDQTIEMPAKGKLSEMDAYLERQGAQRYRTYPEWVAENVVPHTPEGWGVVLATGGAGLAGGLLRASGSLMAPIVRSGAFRIGAGIAGGMAGWALHQKPGDAPPEVDPSAPTSPIQGTIRSLGDAATSAFFQSLLGEAGTYGLNLISRNILNPMIRNTSDAKSYLGWLQENTKGLGNLPQGKAAQQLASLAMDQGLASRASTQIQGAIDQIGMSNTSKTVKSPALSRFLEAAKLEGHPVDPQDVYSIPQALDNYTRVSHWMQGEGMTQARAESIRQAVYRDLKGGLDPANLTKFQGALNEYGFSKNVSDVMSQNRQAIFPPEGGFRADRLAQLVHEHFGKYPENNDFIQSKVQDLLGNLQRGAGLGDPMDIKGSWGGVYTHSSGSTGFNPMKIRLNQWAGDPMTLGPTAKSIGNPIMEKTMESAVGGMGGVPGGYRLQSPVTSQPDQGNIPASQ